MKVFFTSTCAKIGRVFWSWGFLKFILWTVTLIILFYVEEDCRPLEPLAQPRHGHLRALMPANRAGCLRMGLEPFLEVVRDGYKTPLPGLGLVRGHRDKAPV
jgi:hypothetical protein